MSADLRTHIADVLADFGLGGASVREQATEAILDALDRSRPEGSGNPGVTGAQPDEPASQAGRPGAGDA